MIATLLAAAMLATPTVSTALPPACEARLMAYGRALEPAERDWAYTASLPGGGALTYFGAVHSRDPAAPQVGALTAAFNSAKPTLVFFESRERGVGITPADSVERFGEGGLARFLAARDGAQIRTLEPDPADEAGAMLDRFPADQVFLFYVLRHASQQRDRLGLKDEALDASTSKMLTRMAALSASLNTPAPFDTLDGLQAAYARYWPAGGTWREAKTPWFDPRHTSDQTGGVFTNEINAASSHFRNINMAGIVSAAALSGERVFAVVGRDHVASQRAALDCALKVSASAPSAARD